MKKEIGPAAIIGAIVVVVVVLAFFGVRALTGTAPTVSSTTDANRPKTINGQPVPPGVPYDYAQQNGGK